MMTAQRNELLCRICQKRDEVLVSVYNRVEEHQTDLCTLLQRCGNIKVKKWDSYPKYLCQMCTRELITSARFRAKCDATEQAVKERCLQRLQDEEAALSKADLLRRESDILDKEMDPNFNTDDLIEFDPIGTDDPCEGTETAVQPDKSDKTIDTEEENSEVQPTKVHLNCDECGVGFRLAVRLKMHITKLHPGADCYECDKCGYCFTKQQNLKEHICSGPKNFDLLHGGEKIHRCVYCCVYCGECLKSATSLLEHIPKHTEKEPTKQQQSSKSSTRTIDKPHICNLCHRSFAHSGYLKIHRRVHTNERPFSCNVCDRRFISDSYRKAHELTHSRRRKTYNCKHCQKTFKRIDFLTQHQLDCSTHERNTQVDIES